MRTAATIFFLVLLVSIQTPVLEIFKLPILIEHYKKHQKQDGVSLFSFLQDHYSSHHQDADLPEDEQLPFKNITFYAIGSVIIPGVIKTDVLVRLPSDKKVAFSNTYASQQFLGSIFHPPKA
jgi:hypothetical protein